MILRSSNYVMDAEGYYHMPGQTIRTKNALCVLDYNLNLVDYQYLDYNGGWGPVRYELVRGLEDTRLHWKDGAWHVYGTLREHDDNGLCEIAAARIEGNKLVDQFIYQNPEPGRHQKNWMVMTGTDNFIYLVNPPAVLRSGTLETKHGLDPLHSPDFRGSSQAIPFGNGWLAVTHEVDWSTGYRRYSHRFVILDGDGFLLEYTNRFYIVKPEIEFVAGMVEHRDDYVLSFGFRDLWAGLARVPKTALVSQLYHHSR